MNRPAPVTEHPDLLYERYGPNRPPTVEEEEAFAQTVEQRLEYEAEQIARGLAPTVDLEGAQQARAFEERRRRTAGAARLQKRRAPNSTTTPRTRTGRHDAPDPRT